METLSALVTTVNNKRSVGLSLHGDDGLEFVGNVTIPANHDIPKLLKTLAGHLGVKYSGPILSMALQLSTKLANLWCKGKDGNATPLPSHSYPYMRYLRHDSDWESSASTDEELDGVLLISKQIIHTLHKATGEKL